MSWHNLDWVDVEVWDYQTALNDLVREAYLAAYSDLEETFATREKWYTEEMAAAKDEADGEAAYQQLQYAEMRWHEQGRALAAMALALLASLNKSFLDGMKRLFDKTHPQDAKGYARGSQLERQAAEYGARFDIDLEILGGFDSIREIELARNCCLHNEGKPTDDYSQQTRQRFVGEGGKINLTPELLDDLVLDLAGFSKELSNGMKAVRAKLVG